MKKDRAANSLRASLKEGGNYLLGMHSLSVYTKKRKYIVYLTDSEVDYLLQADCRIKRAP